MVSGAAQQCSRQQILDILTGPSKALSYSMKLTLQLHPMATRPARPTRASGAFGFVLTPSTLARFMPALKLRISSQSWFTWSATPLEPASSGASDSPARPWARYEYKLSTGAIAPSIADQFGSRSTIPARSGWSWFAHAANLQQSSQWQPS